MRYDAERAVVLLSVGELCRTALASGHLEWGGGRADREAAMAGSALHRRLQSGRGASYRAEVTLTHTVLYREITYEISGRADGVETCEDGVTVEEIKRVSDYLFFAKPTARHEAQLRVYAHMLCSQQELDGVRTRLLRVRASDDRVREESEWLPAGVLRSAFEQLLERIHPWAQLCVSRATEDLPALMHQRFPYHELREGQERMIRAAFRAIGKGKRLFVNAPTGIGKTMSALYPALRALGQGSCDRIFYLTAKASTRREAFEAARRLVGDGAGIRAVVLTAREQVCPVFGCGTGEQLSSHCNSIDCPLAAGYYDRAPAAVLELLRTGRGYSRTRIAAVAAAHGVCPYELSLDLSEHCDLIIADYNYVFDPMVYLRRYFSGDGVGGSSVLLVDEAHNLVDRAREMYSATLCCRPLEALCRQTAAVHCDRLTEALERTVTQLRGIRRLCRETLTRDARGEECGYYLSRAPLHSLNESVGGLCAVLEAWLREHRQEELAADVGSVVRGLREYLCILEHYDERYVTYCELGGGEVTVRLFCVDPSCVLDRALSRGSAAVLFSATLTPLTYFMDLLGGREGADSLALSSPYTPEHLGLFAVEGISTRYEHREQSAVAIAACIAATISARRGNYIVYFPSYAYLERVLDVFTRRYPAVTTVVQKRRMHPSEREEFLQAFAADRGVLRVGFCVLGGSFSEGVDLPGDRLIGCMIVGVGLSGLSGEGNILQEFFANRYEMGYEYAYLYPGMNRVLQAAGRVIRREEDRGVVVLIDDRYATPAYTTLFPHHWRHLQYAGTPQNLAALVRDFWSNAEDNPQNAGESPKKEKKDGGNFEKFP